MERKNTIFYCGCRAIKFPPIEENDIPDILNRWKHLEGEKKRTRLDRSFLVPVEEIREKEYDLSLNKYKEMKVEQRVYDAPEVILERLAGIDKEIDEVTKELKGLLKEI